jgi:hypothetical protein
VVASGGNDLELGHSPRSFLQKGIKLTGGWNGRTGNIKNVSTNQEGINSLGFEGVEKPIQKGLVLFGPILLIKKLSKVPIGGMK